MRTLPILLCLLLLLSCSDGGRSRHALDALEARNQSDSLLTDSALALRLADYFDRHGTANERLHAHYLLARTWADLGQSPRALDEFHKAAEQADTTNLDSVGYYYLSRVYGQMGGLLYYYELHRNALHAFRKAQEYAARCGENLIAANWLYQQSTCYYHLNQIDSMLYITEQAYSQFLSLGDTLSGNTCLGPISKDYINKGDAKRGRECLNLYRNHSLLNKQTILANENWKLLYYYLGYYYLSIGESDSALVSLYKEDEISLSNNNKALAYKGLYQSYASLNQKDSALKYATLYAETNDSNSRRSMASALLSMQYLYDYSRFKTQADRRTIEAERANTRSLLLLCIISALVIVFSSLMYFLRKRAQHLHRRLSETNRKYYETLLLYNAVKTELESQIVKGQKLESQVEEELGQLRATIAELQQDKRSPEQWGLNNDLLNSRLVLQFHKIASHGEVATDEMWNMFRKQVNARIPKFINEIMSFDYKPDLTETKIILLTKLRFLPSEISILTEMRPSPLSKRRKKLLKLLWGKEGSPEEFDRRIQALGIDEMGDF